MAIHVDPAADRLGNGAGDASARQVGWLARGGLYGWRQPACR
jgi:hypothetical protein